jgi:RNA polymerase sigma-70 factor, ECF subfamily
MKLMDLAPEATHLPYKADLSKKSGQIIFEKWIKMLRISRIIRINWDEMADKQEVTQMLEAISAGDEAAPEQLLSLVYGELRRLAHGYMKNERSDHTLQATALVHEAYIQLVDWKNVSWQNRSHFFAAAAQMMRKILVDHARKKNALKRGGGLRTIILDDAVRFPNQSNVDLVLLDAALNELAAFDLEQSKIVELRFFGGLTIEETAHALGVSDSTVKRDWQIAKAWLFKRMRT